MKITLKKGEEDRLLAGHLWVYGNEIARIEADGPAPDGGAADTDDVADVYAHGGRFIGRGTYNPASKIAVRLLAGKKEPLDRAFFKRRLEAAWKYRRDTCDIRACRVVFSDADMLPGLIVDKFSDILVMQTLTLGMDRRKDMLAGLLCGLLRPAGICERNDAPVREKEGLHETRGVLFGDIPPLVEIRENEARMWVDVMEGQKTGYFLDQKENRAALRPFAPGRRVLDAFCHTGGFSVHAGLYGAKEILAADLSDPALSLARKNFALNGITCAETVCANVFDLLKNYDSAGRRFDLVILDPPAFCKSRAALPGAYRGYKEINLRAMRLLADGGVLMTFSCSHHMTPELFDAMLFDAARDSGRFMRILERRMQAKDHPSAVATAESLYLKCVVLQAGPSEF